MIYLWIFVKLTSLFFIDNAWSYPEMTTHGYNNCTACHASPTGGGLLTQYGRALSKELISEKSKEKIKDDELFLKGNYIPSEKINLGGDIRFLQMFIDNKNETSGRAIFMQADLEAQVEISKRIRILGTAGRQENRVTPTKITDNFISRRHWINILLGPEEDNGISYKEKYQLRLGRFFPAYGLNIPEHTVSTRRGLGFDQGLESYNGEASYLGENWSLFATFVGGRPDKLELNREVGASLQSSITFSPNSRIGANFYTGKAPESGPLGNNDRRTMGGVFGVLALKPNLYSLFELDRTYSPKKSYGLYEYGKLGYEYRQGLHFYTSYEFERPSDVKFDKTREAFSLGVQYFPWVHWEVNTVLQKELTSLFYNGKNSLLTILIHYYL